MRGTKLTAWRVPPVWKDLEETVLSVPTDSNVPKKQERLLRATREVLAEIAKDMREGLLETVGVESLPTIDDGRCSMRLELPEGADTELIARAIDLENVEAWLDRQGKVHIAASPWYSTKDIDQTVLSAIKVIHVLLGLHAADADAAQPKTFKQKFLKSVAEILQIQKSIKK